MLLWGEKKYYARLAAKFRSKILITEQQQQQQQLLKKIRNRYNMNCFSCESHSFTNGLNHNIVHMNRVCIFWPNMNISSVECCPKMRWNAFQFEFGEQKRRKTKRRKEEEEGQEQIMVRENIRYAPCYFASFFYLIFLRSLVFGVLRMRRKRKNNWFVNRQYTQCSLLAVHNSHMESFNFIYLFIIVSMPLPYHAVAWQ